MNMSEENRNQLLALERQVEQIRENKLAKAELMNRLDDEIQSMNAEINQLQAEMMNIYKQA